MKNDLNCKSCKHYAPIGEVTIFRPYCLKDCKKFGIIPNLERCDKYEYLYNLNDEERDFCKRLVEDISLYLTDDKYPELGIIELDSTKDSIITEIMSEKISIKFEKSLKSNVIKVQTILHSPSEPIFVNIYIDPLAELEISNDITKILDNINNREEKIKSEIMLDKFNESISENIRL